MKYLLKGVSDLQAFFSKVVSMAVGVTKLLSCAVWQRMYGSLWYFPGCPSVKSLMNKLNYGALEACVLI